MIALGQSIGFNSRSETLDTVDGLSEDLDKETLGDTVCAHDHDELTVEESGLVFRDLADQLRTS